MNPYPTYEVRKEPAKPSKKSQLWMFAIIGLAWGVFESILYMQVGIGQSDPVSSHNRVDLTMGAFDKLSAIGTLGALVAHHLTKNPILIRLSAFFGTALATYSICNMFMGQLIHFALCLYALPCSSLFY